MRENILALLRGEEKLEESDAFALARERFGDPALLQDLLGEVHAPDAAAMLARRVLALILLLQAAGVGVDLALGALTAIVRVFEPGFIPGNILGARYGSVWLQDWYALGASILQLAVAALVLPRWQAALHAGGRPWLVRWSVRRMLAWLAVLILLAPFTALIPKLLLSISGAIRPNVENIRYLLRHSDRIYSITQTVDQVRSTALTILLCWWSGLTIPRRIAELPPLVFRLSTAVLWFTFWKFLSGLLGAMIRLDVYPGNYAADRLTRPYFQFNGCLFEWHPLELSFILVMLFILVLISPIVWKLPQQMAYVSKTLYESGVKE